MVLNFNVICKNFTCSLLRTFMETIRDIPSSEKEMQYRFAVLM